MAGVLTKRVRVNFLGGRASADIPLGATISSADFNLIPVVTAPEYMVLVLDPDQDFGVPEIVHVTAHLAGDTQMTVVRGQEGTTERGHPASSVWRNTGTAGEYDDIEAMVLLAMPVGSMMLWPKATPPMNWLVCDGSAIPAQYATLIALFGANTPNLTDRFPLGGGTMGNSGGSLSHTHGQKAHSHSTVGSGTLTSVTNTGGHTHVVPDINNGGGHGHTVATTGSGGSHGHDATTGQGGGRATNDTTPGLYSKADLSAGIRPYAPHDHAVTTAGSSHTHGIPDAATNTHDHTISNATTSGSGHEHNVASHDHGNTGDGSAQGSTADTGGANPPYLRVNFIIKAA